MKPVIEELLGEYNSKKKPMNLVFFDDAIEHLTRIHRILRLQQVSQVCLNNIMPTLKTCLSDYDYIEHAPAHALSMIRETSCAYGIESSGMLDDAYSWR